MCVRHLLSALIPSFESDAPIISANGPGMACLSNSNSVLGLFFHVKRGSRERCSHNKLPQHLLSTWQSSCATVLKLACLHNPRSFPPPPWLRCRRKISRSVQLNCTDVFTWAQLSGEITITANLGCRSVDVCVATSVRVCDLYDEPKRNSNAACQFPA